MKKIIPILLSCILLFTGQMTYAQNTNPKDTIKIARSTWDTGWFQTEIFRHLIIDMGYEAAPAQTMMTQEFYKAVSDGEVDFWVNGWFPLHEPLLKQNNKSNNIKVVGYEVKRGAQQGYLVDIKSSEALNIESLADFKKPEVAKHFDVNGNGKADLIGCNLDWSCYNRIEEHLEKLDLNKTVEQISGDYSPMVNQAIQRYQDGAPLLMYTWTPNWTLGEIVPGEDVLWLHVPVEGQELMQDLTGAARNPINLGYDFNDIRVVANASFLQEHEDIRILFENLSIPLSDIQRENAKIVDGEGSLDDIKRHARNWIQTNRDLLDDIFEKLEIQPYSNNGQAAKTSPLYSESEAKNLKDKTIRVVTQQVEPLVGYENQQYTGFSIEIFRAIADIAGFEYSIYSVNSIAKMLDDLKRGEADVATAALGITSEREQILDFSHPYYDTGLQILIPKKESTLSTIPKAILSIIFSKEIMLIFLFFFGVLVLSAHIIWFSERSHNEDFPDQYVKGIGVSIWWAAVTVTTVGYGDKTPKGLPGRLFGLIWIFAGYFAFSYFTATVTSTVTLQEIEGNIQQIEDLYGKNVATINNSSAELYMEDQGLQAETFNNVEDAVEYMLEGNADAVVYDAPVLQHYASTVGYGKVNVTGKIFKVQSYGFALPKNSDLRKIINLGYLELVESGEYQQIRNKWFSN